jgi:hypothetical protein
MTPRRFRALLVSSWIIATLGATMSMALTSTLPEPLRIYVEGQFDPETPLSNREIALMVVAVPLILISIWNLVELLRFRPRARPIYATILFACLVLTPWAGPFVEPGIAVAAYYATGILSGIALALMWWSDPIAAKFDESVRRPSVI